MSNLVYEVELCGGDGDVDVNPETNYSFVASVLDRADLLVLLRVMLTNIDCGFHTELKRRG